MLSERIVPVVVKVNEGGRVRAVKIGQAFVSENEVVLALEPMGLQFEAAEHPVLTSVALGAPATPIPQSTPTPAPTASTQHSMPSMLGPMPPMPAPHVVATPVPAPIHSTPTPAPTTVASMPTPTPALPQFPPSLASDQPAKPIDQRIADLEELARRSRSVLADAKKARWHDDMREQLVRIISEIDRLKNRAPEPAPRASPLKAVG